MKEHTIDRTERYTTILLLVIFCTFLVGLLIVQKNNIEEYKKIMINYRCSYYDETSGSFKSKPKGDK